ncbi:MAG: hypothetical protein ABI400_09315 [Lacisediminihabitans sp.]
MGVRDAPKEIPEARGLDDPSILGLIDGRFVVIARRIDPLTGLADAVVINEYVGNGQFRMTELHLMELGARSNLRNPALSFDGDLPVLHWVENGRGTAVGLSSDFQMVRNQQPPSSRPTVVQRIEISEELARELWDGLGRVGADLGV